jgi:hypothetical protein
MGEGGKEIKNIRKREIELGKRREVREGKWEKLKTEKILELESYNFLFIPFWTMCVIFWLNWFDSIVFKASETKIESYQVFFLVFLFIFILFFS